MSTTRSAITWISLLIAMLVLFVLDIAYGAAKLPFSQVFGYFTGENIQPVTKIIISDFRIPKAVAAIFVGGGLAISGLLMQGLFRNPLAGPYTLGISSGASLLVAFYIILGRSSIFTSEFLGTFGIAISAIIGSFLVLSLVLIISFRVNDSVSLLVVGIMISGLTGSLVTILQYFTSPELLRNYVFWTFGSISGFDATELSIMIPIIILGFAFSLVLRKPLNAMLLGDNYAGNLGVNILKTRTIAIIIAGITAGAITAFAGPIVFVGVAVPHFARSFYKTTDYKILLPSSFIFGSILLLACDLVAQLPNQANALPINAITSMVGAPVIIWIVLKNKSLGRSNF